MADISQLEVNGTTYNICDATARDSLSQYVLKSGSIMSGDIWNVKASPIFKFQDTNLIVDSTTDNHLTQSIYPGIKFYDSTGNFYAGMHDFVAYNNGNVASRVYARNIDSSGNLVENVFQVTANKDGSKSYYCTDPATFRQAIGAVSNTGDTITGPIIAKASNIDRDGSAPSETVYSDVGFLIYDKDLERTGIIRNVQYSSGGIAIQLGAVVEGTSGTEIANFLHVGVAPNGTKTYSVTDAAAFRNAIGASSGIWPISLGGTGQSDITYVTTASQIIAMKSGYTLDSAYCVQWGKMIQFRIRWKASNDITIPANGNIANFIVGTIVSGKRPKINTAWHSHGDDAGQAWGYLDTNGNLIASAFEGTGTTRTITANTVITSDVVYILA